MSTTVPVPESARKNLEKICGGRPRVFAVSSPTFSNGWAGHGCKSSRLRLAAGFSQWALRGAHRVVGRTRRIERVLRRYRRTAANPCYFLFSGRAGAAYRRGHILPRSCPYVLSAEVHTQTPQDRPVLGGVLWGALFCRWGFLGYFFWDGPILPYRKAPRTAGETYGARRRRDDAEVWARRITVGFVNRRLGYALGGGNAIENAHAQDADPPGEAALIPAQGTPDTREARRELAVAIRGARPQRMFELSLLFL